MAGKGFGGWHAVFAPVDVSTDGNLTGALVCPSVEQALDGLQRAFGTPTVVQVVAVSAERVLILWRE